MNNYKHLFKILLLLLNLHSINNILCYNNIINYL